METSLVAELVKLGGTLEWREKKGPGRQYVLWLKQLKGWRCHVRRQGGWGRQRL